MNPDKEAAYDEALQRIEVCRHSGGLQLNLTNLGLTQVPPEIGRLRGLRKLDLSDNQITKLPPEIGQLTALRTLDLSRNLLTKLPPEIGQLTALETLDIYSNSLTTLPPEIGQLTALVMVRLFSNQLTALPPEIGRLKVLKTLLLPDNDLTGLPPEFANLSQLVELDFGHHGYRGNPIKTLPLEVCELHHLERLDLTDNQLVTLPPEISKLRRLEKLILEQNALRELPDSIRSLTQLKVLVLHDNDGLGLPAEIIGRPYSEFVEGDEVAKPKDILDYYFTHRLAALEGTEPLMEAKILVLGEASVGKSCLIAALSEGKKRSQLDGKGTSGIVRKLWEAPVNGDKLAADPNEEGLETLRLNCWDFGGQEIYHSAHTLFLTKRAVYLIVVSKRENERQNNIDYWVRMALSFGGPDAVTYVVVNKSDEKVGHPPDEEALRLKYPHVRGFLRTSCDDLSGIADARAVIVREALQLQGVRVAVAKSWLAVKKRLERMPDHTLSMKEWADLCGAKVSTPEAQRELLHLCDRLGTVRYFPTTKPDSVELCETAILNPEWVTLGIYALLDDGALKKRGGLLSRPEMTAILKRRNYPAEHERLIEEVMRRFDLLYDSADHGEGHRMLIPLMLPEPMPAIEWPKEGALEFVYQYEVMPAGLVPAFTARMHRFLTNDTPPWRHGCVLELKDCRARVIGDAETKRVQISVTGPRALRREALDMVRLCFEALHSAVENLPVAQLIPVPGHPKAAMLDYDFVRSLEWKGITEFETKGAFFGETLTVNVHEALDGVRGEEKKQRDEERRILCRKEERLPESTPPPPVPVTAPSEVWWKSWTAISAYTALGSGVAVLFLWKWGNPTAWIISGVIVAVFAVMMGHNPKLRFRRQFQWAIAGWMVANGLGVAIAAKWTNKEGEAVFKWDGVVSWSFNGVFAIVAVITGFLAYKEWQKETH